MPWEAQWKIKIREYEFEFYELALFREKLIGHWSKFFEDNIPTGQRQKRYHFSLGKHRVMALN